jgi:hypothetical protein
VLDKLLSLNPLQITPELAALRDSLITERLKASCEALDRLLEE